MKGDIFYKNQIHKGFIPIFPDEITDLILLRLPVKPLLKFRCVSKSWCSLISSKYFIKSHLEFSIQNPDFSNHDIVIASWTGEGFYLHHQSCQFILSEPICSYLISYDPTFKYEYEFPFSFVHIIGYCNGLCCALIIGKVGFLLLWNPSTRKCIKLQTLENATVTGCSFYGFGFDESKDEYKALVGLSPYPTLLEHNDGIYISSLKSDNSWKKIDHPFKRRDYDISDPLGTCVEGKLHWLIRHGDEKINNDKGFDIVCFNLETEMYDGVLDKPFYLRCCENSSRMEVVGGCLCVVSINQKELSNDVWVLKEYGIKDSWVKLMTIPSFTTFRNTPLAPTPLCIAPQGEIMFECGGPFYVYDPEKDTSPRTISPAPLFGLQLNVCAQSLVSPY